MYIELKEDLSLFYHVKNVLDNLGINVVDDFPQEDLVLPTVSVEAKTVDTEDYELGNSEQMRMRVFDLNIFAKTKTQRDDIGYLLLHSFDRGVIVYNYDEGFPPDSTPSKIGHLDVISRHLSFFRPDPNLTEQLYYRAFLRIVVKTI